MARDDGRDPRDWDYPGDGGRAYHGRGREGGAGAGRGWGARPDERHREFEDSWEAQGERWREYEQRTGGRDYPRADQARDYRGGTGRDDYRGDEGGRDAGMDAYRWDASRGSLPRGRDESYDRGGRGDLRGQSRYDFTGRSWHAGPEHWDQGPGPDAFRGPDMGGGAMRGGAGAGHDRPSSGGPGAYGGERGGFRGFGGEGYVTGNTGGYGHGGALEYGRGGMDVGGRDQDWGLGDTRYPGSMAGTSGRSYAGMGPRTYRRSDERIREEVCEALTRHPGIDASDIDIRVESGAVTLMGEVEDRRSRRLAEEICEQCAGVTDVQNELRARRGIGGAMGQTSDRDVTRAATREAGSSSAGASSATSGGSGKRSVGAGMDSPDSTQAALRVDTDEVDGRTRGGGSR